jgi:hypothetical protein
VTPRPSSGAQVIAQLVRVLDDRTCQQLRALLADDIATCDALKPAVSSLAGVATLIDTLGCVPTIEEYEHARTEHPAWPHHSSLGRRYGSWLSAVSAAVKVTSDAPSWGRPTRAEPQRAFSRADCVHAIGRCKRAIGDWPGQHEYALWQCIEADICRRTGTLDRTPPRESTLRRRLRTWPDAIELARRLAGSTPTPPTSTPKPPASHATRS